MLGGFGFGSGFVVNALVKARLEWLRLCKCALLI